MFIKCLYTCWPHASCSIIQSKHVCRYVPAGHTSHPLPYYPQLLQRGTPPKYTGMMDVIQKTLAREGWRGLYKGLLPNLIKLAPAAGISWYVFEETKLALGVNDQHRHQYHHKLEKERGEEGGAAAQCQGEEAVAQQA